MTIQFSPSRSVADVAFLLLPRFSNHCLANALEPFRAANGLSGRTLYRWRLASLGEPAVTSSSGVEVRTPFRLDLLGKTDHLFVLSSYDYRRLATARMRTSLRRAARRSEFIGGLDTGSYLLAHAGLLDGHRATIHWQELEAFEESFPRTEVVADRFVIDGRRISAGGATTALDLMLHLIGEKHGEALRLDVTGLFIYDRPHAGGDPQRVAPVAPPPGHAPVVSRAIAVMDANLEEPLAIGEVARRAGCSQRELEKRFRASLGITPVFYYRHLRLAASRRLVMESEKKVADIAVRTGFASASALTRAFREHFGDTPRQLRSTLRTGV
ncbi:MAG: GlxA family transcriptional regulator [Gammaproteobacteria bacterium]|nr:GlxA family transcriptional regulator [Gammaproteobacteria bacterium]